MTMTPGLACEMTFGDTVASHSVHWTSISPLRAAMSSVVKRALLLTGFAGSGKDAMAAGLPAEYQRFALADTLKEFGMAVMGDMWNMNVTRHMFYDPETKERPLACPIGDRLAGRNLTPRWFLQWLGTEMCRKHLGPDVWVNAVISKIDAANCSHVVVTDVRFPNEAKLLPKLLAERGYEVHVVRIIDPSKPAVDASTLHASEAHVPTLPVHDEFENRRHADMDASASIRASSLQFNARYAYGMR